MNHTGGFRNLLSSFTILYYITCILPNTGLLRGGQGVKVQIEGVQLLLLLWQLLLLMLLLLLLLWHKCQMAETGGGSHPTRATSQTPHSHLQNRPTHQHINTSPVTTPDAIVVYGMIINLDVELPFFYSMWMCHCFIPARRVLYTLLTLQGK